MINSISDYLFDTVRFLFVPVVIFCILAFIETRYLKFVEKRKYKKLIEDLKFYKRGYYGLSDRIDDLEDYLKDHYYDLKRSADLNDDFLNGESYFLSTFIDDCFDYLWSDIDD